MAPDGWITLAPAAPAAHMPQHTPAIALADRPAVAADVAALGLRGTARKWATSYARVYRAMRRMEAAERAGAIELL
jgi:hypothetical protein